MLTHPSFFYTLRQHAERLVDKYTCTDITQYHSYFILSLLLVARYFARVFCRQRRIVSSNGAVLMLCGAAGAGKSVITNILNHFCGGYKWIDGQFQSEQILTSSCIVVEEIAIDKLRDGKYK